jgi:nitroreductase
MDVMAAIAQRYSCRAYEPNPVEREKLNQILEAARLAPSARNFQDWRFVVVTDPQKRKEMMAAARNQAFVGQAPVVIAACSASSHVMRCGQPVGPIDVSIALEHIALAATSLGLATCWVGSFVPEEVRRILHIPTEIMVVELMTLGYPADAPKQPDRLPLDQIVCRDKWSF